MLSKTKAIILHSIKYRESDIIAQAFTETYGKQSFLIHGVRKKKSALSSYLFKPFSLLEIVAYFKESRDLQRVKEIRPTVVLKTIHFDIKKSSIALFLSELMNRTLREIEPNPQLFNYLNHAVQILDFEEEGIENFHLIFLMQLTKFLGVYPKNNLDLSRYTIPGDFQIKHLLDLSLSDAKKLKIENSLRSQLLDQLLKYYKDHIEGIGKIKSVDVLRDVFAF